MKLDSAVLYTNNLEKVIDFYQNFIGLEIDYVQEGKFVSFKFDNARLGIKLKKEEREVPGHQTLFIESQDIENLYLKLKEKGADFHSDLKTESWGTYFNVYDPDQNKIEFIRRS